MSQKRLSMRKIREVLRLRFGLSLGQEEIARSCSIAQATVHRYLERATTAGLTWPLPDEVDDQRLNELLFPTRAVYPPATPRPGLDFADVHRQLQKNKHVTLQLLWEEYRETQPGGYRYSRFCELYRRWSRNQDVVLRQDHKAGEKLFVDWAGPTIAVHDNKTGEVAPASLFVAVLGASTYTFARAALGQHLANWIDCHVRAFDYFHGVPKLIVPDFVPGNKIGILWRLALCGPGVKGSDRSGRNAWMTEHNPHSESSHFNRSASWRHPAAGRHSTERSTGGAHVATAACFVRNVISA